MQQSGEWLEKWVGPHGYVILTIFAMLLVGQFVYGRLSARAKELPSRNVFPLLMKQLRLPVYALFFLISAFIIIHDRTWLGDRYQHDAEHIIWLGLIGLGGWFLLAVLNALRQSMLRRYDIGVADNFLARKMHTQMSLLYRLLSFTVIIVTIALMLMTFEEVKNLGRSLLASAGVAGIIIGFAAQKTIGSVFAGIQIAITQPIRIEDAVVVEGEWGWVEEITLTYVVVRIWDKRRLIIPITYFIEKPFQNWTRQDAEIIGEVKLHTDYNVPIEAMRVELTRLLQETPLWNGQVNVLQVVDTTPREVVLRALMSARDSPTTWDLRCFVREGLIAWMQKYHPGSLPQTRLVLEKDHQSPMAAEDFS